MVNSNGCATHSPASLAEAPGASTVSGIGGRSVVRFDVHLVRDWPVEWLLQLLAVIVITILLNSHVDKTLSATAPNFSYSLSPLSISFTDHSPSSFPPATS